jgi:hypothetical protein
MWENLKDAIGAFFKDPITFLDDPTTATIQYKVTSGEYTPDEAVTAINSSVVGQAGQVADTTVHYVENTAGDVFGAVDQAGKSLTSLLKEIPLLVAIAVVGVVVYVVLMGKRGRSLV